MARAAVPVRTGRTSAAASTSDSTPDAQLRFADVLRYNPWHSLAEHKPLGNSNRARRPDVLRSSRSSVSHMNRVEHVEPNGDELFSDD